MAPFAAVFPLKADIQFAQAVDGVGFLFLWAADLKRDFFLWAVSVFRGRDHVFVDVHAVFFCQILGNIFLIGFLFWIVSSVCHFFILLFFGHELVANWLSFFYSAVEWSLFGICSVIITKYCSFLVIIWFVF